jgi:EAL domain-containing protein (putative c-di-GMP-specific phosphodiesterase class I)/ActR/RegA family two-component response regulator
MAASGRLLVLEDDPGVGNVFRMIAGAARIPVRVVSSPDAFFRSIKEWQPTHIALDLVMPEMDGIEVLAQLATRACTAKIIISSGMGSRVLDAAHRSASAHGLNVVGVLAKPFTTQALRAFLVDTPDSAAVSDPGASMSANGSSLVLTEADLKEGVRDNHFRVVYQPKVACQANTVVGFEALVRWQHPGLGQIMPDRFISFAERHGLIDALTDTVIRQALDWFSLQPAKAADLSLAINMSAVSLNDKSLVERVTRQCQARGISTSRVILELTETGAMENPTTALDILTRMRMKGFQLSIDDFGTGYSSMLQLVRMPFSEIKIDRSFVVSAIRSEESRAVVKSIVDLGRSLGLTSTAEGVEDEQTMAFLRQVGCDRAQGYWIGRPMNEIDIQSWLESRANGGGTNRQPGSKSL